MFCLFYVIISGCKQFAYNAFDVIPDIAGFGKRSSICDCKRYIKQSCQCLDQIGFSTSGWSNHKHIGFFDFNFIGIVCKYSFIMIVNGHRHYFFCIFLSNYIRIQAFFDFMRCRYTADIKYLFGDFFICFFFRLSFFLFNSLFFWNFIL